MRPPLAALVPFGVFLAGNLLAGERFPFSRYAMYADAAGRSEGAVPEVRVDGRAVDPEALTGFWGVGPEHLDPAGVPCSLGYELGRIRGWLGAARGAGPGEVPVEVGWRWVRLGDGGIEQRWTPTATGTARWR